MLIPEAALEAVVVIGVVGRVVWALLGYESLFWEAGGLVTLTTLAFVMEYASWKSRLLQQLKPRPNLSSGILLGAVTPPVVLSARFVQLLRHSANSGEVSSAAVEMLKVELWLALACSTSMLMMLISFLQKRGAGSWKCAAFLEYSHIASFFLFTPGQKLTISWIAIWAGVYILGAKGLFSYALRLFPFTGTLGEVMIVVEGIVLCGASAAAWSLPGVLSSKDEASDLDPRQHLLGTVVQGTILGVLLTPLIYRILNRALPFMFGQFIPKRTKGGSPVVNKAALFYIVLSLVIFVAVPMWLGMVTGMRMNPLLYAIQFILQKPFKRILICAYWVGVIVVPLPHLYHISVSGRVPKILVRKYYHVMIVIMFVPALLFDPEFLQLAFGVALAAFLVVEMVRVWRLPPVGHQIENFMKPFTDHRDSGALIISHFSLLLGCALPVWLNSGPGGRPLASYAGILSLGIGDTMASVVGYNYGSIHVSSKSKKTVEGTVSGISSVLVSCLVLTPILSLTTRPDVLNGFWSLLGASVIGGILEAYTLQLDNVFIPLIFYTLLCL